MQNIDALEQKALQGVISIYEDATLFHSVTGERISAGRPLTLNSLKKIFGFIEKDGELNNFEFSGFIPKNVINFKQDGSIIFYTEPMRKVLIFSEKLKMKNYEITTPYLLWVYSNSSLDLFALAKKPKDENDYLYQAPFLNINSSGGVCMGNVQFKNKNMSFDHFMDYLVNQFFNSMFTHTNTTNLSKISIQETYKKATDHKFNWAPFLVKQKSQIKNIL